MIKPRNSTYERFITGPLLRFDDRNVAFSMCSYQPKLVQWDSSRVEKKGYEQRDYALAWAGRTVDFLVRGNLYSRHAEVATSRVDVSDTFIKPRPSGLNVNWSSPISSAENIFLRTVSHALNFISLISATFQLLLPI